MEMVIPRSWILYTPRDRERAEKKIIENIELLEETARVKTRVVEEANTGLMGIAIPWEEAEQIYHDSDLWIKRELVEEGNIVYIVTYNNDELLPEMLLDDVRVTWTRSLHIAIRIPDGTKVDELVLPEDYYLRRSEIMASSLLGVNQTDERELFHRLLRRGYLKDLPDLERRIMSDLDLSYTLWAQHRDNYLRLINIEW